MASTAVVSEPRGAERFAGRLIGTAQAGHGPVVDIIIEDLSLTGLSTTACDGLARAGVVLVGIPGMGSRAAKVVRQSSGWIGYEFHEPLAPEELLQAFAATPVSPGIGATTLSEPVALDQEHAIVRLPVRTRALLLVTLSVLSWAAAIGAVAVVF